jgi:hypothetical protein
MEAKRPVNQVIVRNSLREMTRVLQKLVPLLERSRLAHLTYGSGRLVRNVVANCRSVKLADPRIGPEYQ